MPLIIGFTKAIELAVLNQQTNTTKLRNYRDYVLKGILENNSQIIINGSLEKRLPHNLNITINGVSGSRLHKELKPKIICSSGSACSNGKPSHVLLALGRNFKQAEASIRLSIGLLTTDDDIQKTVEIMNSTISFLRSNFY